MVIKKKNIYIYIYRSIHEYSLILSIHSVFILRIIILVCVTYGCSFFIRQMRVTLEKLISELLFFSSFFLVSKNIPS